MENSTETKTPGEALRLAGIALMEARHQFRLAHERYLVSTGTDPEVARNLAYEFAFGN